MTGTSLDRLDAAIAAATPSLGPSDRLLVQTIYRTLGGGRPAPPSDLAGVIGSSPTEVERRLAAWPGVFLDDGVVVGFWGLALPEMPHRVTFHEGAAVHAWCAWDPLFIAPIVGPAQVETTDPVSHRPIRYELGPGGVTDPDGDQVLSFLSPNGRWDHDVLGTFCHHVMHFTSRETGEQWVASHPDTFLLPLADAVELGRRHAARLATRD